MVSVVVSTCLLPVAGNLQLRAPIFIPSRNQERHTKRPTHDTLLSLRTLTEPQRQITNRLRTALHSKFLIVIESVVLGLDSCVFDHTSRIGLQAGHSATDVSVNLDNFLYAAGDEERGRHAFFDAEEDAVRGCDLREMSMGGKKDSEVRVMRTPIAVDPSLMASKEYSTWKRRPSGEKVLPVVSGQSSVALTWCSLNAPVVF
jgi:hypothetical protein